MTSVVVSTPHRFTPRIVAPPAGHGERRTLISVPVTYQFVWGIAYQSGEPVRPGGRVLSDGEPGYVEDVADSSRPGAGADADRFVQEFSGGLRARVQLHGMRLPRR